MPEQIQTSCVVLLALFIVLGTTGYSIYIFLTRAKEMGKLKTSATLGITAGIGAFLCLSLASWLVSVPANTIEENLEIPVLLSLLITIMTFAGTYIQQVGNEFWEKQGKKKHKLK
ncbi:MAG: hypothetical protein HY868_19630 [Chloroflexi bacterium]|nr:hypothetical protein [Chloroflexota bacterium]